MSVRGEMQAERAGPGAFFAARWRGAVPLGRLFWFDMVLVGTMINIVATIGSLLALAADAPFALALAIHFLTLPYNLFLFACVWRRSAEADANTAFAARAGAALWLIAATLI